MARTITVKKHNTKEIKNDEDPLFVIKINGKPILYINERSEAKLWNKIEKAIKGIK
jgi:hypothetical protein